jgi:hypothetical protein
LRILLLASLTVFAGVAPASAQARVESVLQPGVRVRYLVPRAPRPFTGLVQQVDTLEIVVRPDGHDQSISLGLDSLRSLAVFGGVRSSEDGARDGAVAGFQIGALLGAVVTAAVWLSPADERCTDCWVSSTAAAAVASALGTLVLGLLGGLLGAVSPGEMWHDIPLRVHRRPSS